MSADSNKSRCKAKYISIFIESCEEVGRAEATFGGLVIFRGSLLSGFISGHDFLTFFSGSRYFQGLVTFGSLRYIETQSIPIFIDRARRAFYGQKHFLSSKFPYGKSHNTRRSLVNYYAYYFQVQVFHPIYVANSLIMLFRRSRSDH